MIEFKKIANFKAAVVGALVLTALSGLVPESAEAGQAQVGISHSKHEIATPGGTIVILDPPPGTFFDGRITVRYDRNRVLPIRKDDSGWFGSFSNDPQATFPDTGDGIFADLNTPFNLLEPNDDLTESVCTVQFIDFSDFPRPSPENLEPRIQCDGEFFNPFFGLLSSEDESAPLFNPQELFPDDDFFAVNFNFEDGLTIDTEESFNFFGFSAQFDRKAFDNKVVGISLVESGTGDLGLVPLNGFNIINCIPQDSSGSSDDTDRCGEPDFPKDVSYVTDALVLADSNNPDFVYDFTNKEGTLSNGNPFQLFDDSFLPRENVDEPHNNLGLLALGSFGASFIIKRRKKHHKNS